MQSTSGWKARTLTRYANPGEQLAPVSNPDERMLVQVQPWSLNREKNMDNKNITINGVEYTPVKSNGPWSVAVIECGWVLIGKITKTEESMIIADAYCARKFGFGDGVASFVTRRPDLVLDKYPSDVEVPLSKVLMSFALPDDWDIDA